MTATKPSKKYSLKEKTASPILRVCSYNIHKGFNAKNTEFLLKSIRQAVRLTDADIVFLQEVVGKDSKHAKSHYHWPRDSQWEFIADSIWHHHAYGKNAIYDHGHHGNALLSRFPLLAPNNINVSLIPYSRRGVLHATIQDNLHLFCIHFGLLALERKIQIKKLVRIIRNNVEDNSPMIIAGDFNDWRNRASRYLLKELNVKEALFEINGRSQATFPASAPLLAMDRIYYRGLDLTHAEVLSGEPWHQLSDHCAVYAEFRL